MHKFLPVLVLVFVEISVYSLGPAKKPPVCVIGGGISGLTIAIKLQEAGHHVQLYESAPRFGGKLETLYDPGRKGVILEKGPVIFTPWMNYTDTYTKKFATPVNPFVVRTRSLFHPESGHIIGRYESTEEQRNLHLQLLKVYETVWTTNFDYLNEVGFPNLHKADPDLLLPTSEFLRKKSIVGLTPIFIYYMTLLGYGDLRNTPAFYTLKALSPREVENFITGQRPIYTPRYGFQNLVDNMADTCGEKFANHELVSLRRNDNQEQSATFLVDGNLITKTCSKTILAFPPILSNLVGIIQDLTVEEKAVLKQVKVIKYASSGHIIPSLKDDVYLGLIPEPNGKSIQYPEGKGNLFFLIKPMKGDNPQAYTGYSWLEGDDNFLFVEDEFDPSVGPPRSQLGEMQQ